MVYKEPTKWKLYTITAICDLGTKLDIRKVVEVFPIEYNNIISIKYRNIRKRIKNWTTKGKDTKDFYNQCTLEVRATGDKVVNVKIFNNGKLQMTGCKNENDITIVCLKIVYLLNKYQCDCRDIEKINNIKLIGKMISNNVKGIDKFYNDDIRIFIKNISRLSRKNKENLIISIGNYHKDNNRINLFKYANLIYSSDLDDITNLNIKKLEKKYQKIEDRREKIHISVQSIKIGMINTGFDALCTINRSKLCEVLRYKYNKYATFDPLLHVGVNMVYYIDNDDTDKSKKVDILIFSTGRILIIAKSRKYIQKGYDFINGVIHKHYGVVAKDKDKSNVIIPPSKKIIYKKDSKTILNVVKRI